MINTFKGSGVMMLVLGLAACAPTVTGSKVYSPVVATSSFLPASVLPGQTVYVQYTYPNALIKVSGARFSELRFEANGRSMDGNIVSQEGQAPWLHIRPEGLPAGWSVTLEKATLVKQATRTTEERDGSTVYFYPEMVVVYKLTAPSDVDSYATVKLQFLDGSDPIGSTFLMLQLQK